MRILLVWPNSRNEILGWGDLGAVAEPLSLEYLGAALETENHDVRILDLRLHADQLVTVLSEFRPHLVGITAFTMHVTRALQIASQVKAIDPSIATIVGGQHATFRPQDFFVDQMDFVVSGDGISLINEVVDSVVAGRSPQERPGLYFRSADTGTFVGSGRSTYTEPEFRDIIQPNRSLTKSDRHRYFIDDMKPVALMRTSVGCPYRCTFCSIWKAMDGRYFTQDAENVLAELRTIKEHDIFLVDDEAFINERRMLTLAETIAKSGIRKNYFTYCRIDTLLKNRAAIEAWRDIGLTRLFVGIDAISIKDLDEYHKKCEISQIEAGIELARDMGIEIFAQFVVNTDYAKGDFKTLVRFIEHHGIDYPSFTVLTPLPGTPLLQDGVVTRRQANGMPNWDLFDCQNAVTETRLSPEEFRREYRSLYKVFKGAYTQYREHNHIVHELSAEEALRTGHPTSAMRTEISIV